MLITVLTLKFKPKQSANLSLRTQRLCQLKNLVRVFTNYRPRGVISFARQPYWAPPMADGCRILDSQIGLLSLSYVSLSL